MPTDHIRYDLLVQDALRSVVRQVLTEAARTGLPGDHHFNISFKTHAPGVALPAAIKQRYPDEMAIILQHEFWDLNVVADQFEVSLNFSRKPERVVVPFDAITGFSVLKEFVDVETAKCAGRGNFNAPRDTRAPEIGSDR